MAKLLGRSVLNQALLEGRNCARIDVVFDVYRKTSIKNAERSRRGSGGSTQWKNIAPGHTVMQWRKLLSDAESKTSLIQFLVNQWKQEESRAKLQGKQLMTSCGETCYCLSEEAWDIVEELKCSHEEADTRMLFHANHASKNGYETLLVVSEDTDVMILSLVCCKSINALLCQKAGTQNRTRYINISKLAQCLGEDLCDALIGMHAFTGCDSTSAFADQGKLKALKLVKGSKTFQDSFKSLGTSWAVSEEVHRNMESFVCRMYAPSSSICDINDVRYMLFCAKRGEVDSSSLPPCRDCLKLHIQRANYQAGIWRHCLEGQPDIPEPRGHGWTTNDKGT
ncbi:hypothetical protein ACEWY4_007516 [Coilia grayii]|uniref:Uncharacterized protein n=1 Tax=Coilia grayii TaxID=363190 RepID=A0ABD1KGH4_9TELE